MNGRHWREHGFLQKIGRCQRCLDHLTVLSVLCWLVWWFGYQDDLHSLGSIALIVAGFAFNALLFLHLWMRFVILPWQRRERKNQARGNSNDR